MADKMEFTPELTLTPDLSAPVVETAPKTELAAADEEAQAIQLDESRLTEAERKMVDDFVQKIDLTDTNLVL